VGTELMPVSKVIFLVLIAATLGMAKKYLLEAVA
jgi:hypothetical protein